MQGLESRDGRGREGGHREGRDSPRAFPGKALRVERAGASELGSPGIILGEALLRGEGPQRQGRRRPGGVDGSSSHSFEARANSLLCAASAAALAHQGSSGVAQDRVQRATPQVPVTFTMEHAQCHEVRANRDEPLFLTSMWERAPQTVV